MACGPQREVGQTILGAGGGSQDETTRKNQLLQNPCSGNQVYCLCSELPGFATPPGLPQCLLKNYKSHEALLPVAPTTTTITAQRLRVGRTVIQMKEA